MLDVFVHAVVVYVVRSRLGPQQPIVAHVLPSKTMPVMAADHGIGQVEIFDHGLQFALVLFSHLASEDHGDLLGLSDRPVQVQQSLGEFVHRCPAMADEVVAILHLRKEETMLAPSLFAFLVRDERGERCQPLLTALP